MRTIHEHVAAIREGRDYHSPMLACNETIEGLVHCGLIIRSSEDGALLSPEARALDAIGVQVERELKNRKEIVMALADRLNVVEALLMDARDKGYVPPETPDAVVGQPDRPVLHIMTEVV